MPLGDPTQKSKSLPIVNTTYDHHRTVVKRSLSVSNNPPDDRMTLGAHIEQCTEKVEPNLNPSKPSQETEKKTLMHLMESLRMLSTDDMEVESDTDSIDGAEQLLLSAVSLLGTTQEEDHHSNLSNSSGKIPNSKKPVEVDIINAGLEAETNTEIETTSNLNSGTMKSNLAIHEENGWSDFSDDDMEDGSFTELKNIQILNFQSQQSMEIVVSDQKRCSLPTEDVPVERETTTDQPIQCLDQNMNVVSETPTQIAISAVGVYSDIPPDTVANAPMNVPSEQAQSSSTENFDKNIQQDSSSEQAKQELVASTTDQPSRQGIISLKELPSWETTLPSSRPETSKPASKRGSTASIASSKERFQKVTGYARLHQTKSQSLDSKEVLNKPSTSGDQLRESREEITDLAPNDESRHFQPQREYASPVPGKNLLGIQAQYGAEPYSKMTALSHPSPSPFMTWTPNECHPLFLQQHQSPIQTALPSPPVAMSPQFAMSPISPTMFPYPYNTKYATHPMFATSPAPNPMLPTSPAPQYSTSPTSPLQHPSPTDRSIVRPYTISDYKRQKVQTLPQLRRLGGLGPNKDEKHQESQIKRQRQKDYIASLFHSSGAMAQVLPPMKTKHGVTGSERWEDGSEGVGPRQEPRVSPTLRTSHPNAMGRAIYAIQKELAARRRAKVNTAIT